VTAGSGAERRGESMFRQPDVMIRTLVLQTAGAHRAEVPEASDYHLCLWLASTGHVAWIRGAGQGLYRIHAMSMQHATHGVLLDLRARLRAFELFLDERGSTLKDAERVRRRMHRALAREALLRVLDSYDAGTADSEPFDEFRDLARSLDPGITTSRRWRELRHRDMVSRAVPTRPLSPGRFFRQIRWNHRGSLDAQVSDVTGGAGLSFDSPDMPLLCRSTRTFHKAWSQGDD
jgi:hypothetical protein